MFVHRHPDEYFCCVLASVLLLTIAAVIIKRMIDASCLVGPKLRPPVFIAHTFLFQFAQSYLELGTRHR